MKKGENMKKFFCVLCGICLFYMGYAQEKEVKAVIETNLGNMIVKLYNDTPNHRDNFVRLAKAGHYDGSLFYRVIKNFVIQGGSSDSKKAIKGAAIGYGKPIVIDAEIKPEHYHKKGALAAPRQPDRVNFFKESDISQFYIVQGRKYDPKELDIIEKQVNVPIKMGYSAKILYSGEKSYPGHPPKTEKSKRIPGNCRENQTGYRFRLECQSQQNLYAGGKTECLYKRRRYTPFG